MKRFALTTAALSALMAAPAFADVEQAGALTFDELQVEYPGLGESLWQEVDKNKDGVADMEEIDQAEQSGVLTAEMSADAHGAATVATITADVDEDKVMTFKELKVEYPDVTRKVWEQVDKDKDGIADMEEIAQAEQSGILEQS